ncbi:hypothetical protein EATA6166_19770 [Enterobacter asburiae]|nr:hypothetical protein EATA6166_19770 [Enterobacter asburiae]
MILFNLFMIGFDSFGAFLFEFFFMLLFDLFYLLSRLKLCFVSDIIDNSLH